MSFFISYAAASSATPQTPIRRMIRHFQPADAKTAAAAPQSLDDTSRFSQAFAVAGYRMADASIFTTPACAFFTPRLSRRSAFFARFSPLSSFPFCFCNTDDSPIALQRRFVTDRIRQVGALYQHTPPGRENTQ